MRAINNAEVKAQFTDQFRKNITASLRENSGAEKSIKKLGNMLAKQEKDLIKLMSDENANPGHVKAAEIRYQRILQAFESFSKIMENKFQILMQGIRSLNVR